MRTCIQLTHARARLLPVQELNGNKGRENIDLWDAGFTMDGMKPNSEERSPAMIE